MLPHVPFYVSATFALTTALTVWLFFRATGRNRSVLWWLVGWAALQGALALAGFYQITDTLPPRAGLLVGPPLLVIVALVSTRRGRRWLDGLALDRLTLLHVVRGPVEVCLLWLFWAGAVPQSMTFEGRNFDVLSGLTAPVVYYVAFRRKSLPRWALLGWNVACTGLLVNIVLTGILSAPSRFQQLAFDQPNVAILYVPFVWLPSVVVPLVLLAHVAAYRQLRRRATSANRYVLNEV